MRGVKGKKASHFDILSHLTCTHGVHACRGCATHVHFGGKGGVNWGLCHTALLYELHGDYRFRNASGTCCEGSFGCRRVAHHSDFRLLDTFGPLPLCACSTRFSSMTELEVVPGAGAATTVEAMDRQPYDSKEHRDCLRTVRKCRPLQRLTPCLRPTFRRIWTRLGRRAA